MKVFVIYYSDVVFMVFFFYVLEVDVELLLKFIGYVDEIKEEYYVIFVECMIQYLVVKNVCDVDFINLFL